LIKNKQFTEKEKIGGAKGDRTLTSTMPLCALSQLSYGPHAEQGR